MDDVQAAIRKHERRVLVHHRETYFKSGDGKAAVDKARCGFIWDLVESNAHVVLAKEREAYRTRLLTDRTFAAAEFNELQRLYQHDNPQSHSEHSEFRRAVRTRDVVEFIRVGDSMPQNIRLQQVLQQRHDMQNIADPQKLVNQAAVLLTSGEFKKALRYVNEPAELIVQLANLEYEPPVVELPSVQQQMEWHELAQQEAQARAELVRELHQHAEMLDDPDEKTRNAARKSMNNLQRRLDTMDGLNRAVDTYYRYNAFGETKMTIFTADRTAALENKIVEVQEELGELMENPAKNMSELQKDIDATLNILEKAKQAFKNDVQAERAEKQNTTSNTQSQATKAENKSVDDLQKAFEAIKIETKHSSEQKPPSAPEEPLKDNAPSAPEEPPGDNASSAPEERKPGATIVYSDGIPDTELSKSDNSPWGLFSQQQ